MSKGEATLLSVFLRFTVECKVSHQSLEEAVQSLQLGVHLPNTCWPLGYYDVFVHPTPSILLYRVDIKIYYMTNSQFEVHLIHFPFPVTNKRGLSLESSPALLLQTLLIKPLLIQAMLLNSLLFKSLLVVFLH